jgi:hypothetical protein
METTARYIVDEIMEEQCGEVESFKIDNDEKASWALEKIAIERAESQRYINTCESMILAYQDKMAKERERLANKTAYLEGQLREYFDGVEKKETKTKASYRLPTGTLTMKFKKKIDKDDHKLTLYMGDNGLDEYLDEVYTVKPKWAEFKKTLNFVDGKAVTSDGEVLEFITETTEEEFVMEV